MCSLGKFKLLGLTTLLIALLASVGGLVISQAAGGQSGIQAMVYDDAVRFAVEDGRVSLVRAEVSDLAGKRLFDSGPG